MNERAQPSEFFEPKDEDSIEDLFDKLDECTNIIIGIVGQLEVSSNQDPKWRRKAIVARESYTRSKSMLEKEIRYRERHQLPSLIVEEAKIVIVSQFGKESWATICQRAELKYVGETVGTQEQTED